MGQVERDRAHTPTSPGPRHDHKLSQRGVLIKHIQKSREKDHMTKGEDLQNLFSGYDDPALWEPSFEKQVAQRVKELTSEVLFALVRNQTAKKLPVWEYPSARVTIGTQELSAYMDTMAADSFISQDAVDELEARMDVKFVRRQGRVFKPATGGPVESSVIDVGFQLQGQHYSVSLHVLELNVKAIILGMPFLSKHSFALNLSPEGIYKAALGNAPLQLDQVGRGGRQYNFEVMNALMEDPELQDEYAKGELVMALISSFPEATDDGLKKPVSTVQEYKLSKKQQAIIREFKEEFKDVYGEFAYSDLNQNNRKAFIELIDKSKENPYSRSTGKLGPAKLAAAEAMVKDLLRRGLIEESTSAWGAPLLLIGKQDGDGNPSGFRVCLDYRALNQQTKRFSYPLPRIDVLLSKLAQNNIFAGFDLESGFYQMILEESSRDYTSFQGPSGLYRFTVLPMGISNGPALFSRFVHSIFQGFEEIFQIYLDDVAIGSKNFEEHMKKLRKFHEICRSKGLRLKEAKSFLTASRIHFLGHLISRNSIRMLGRNTKKILKEPRTKTELRSQLGLLNYYRAFIPYFSQTAVPLYQLCKTSGNQGNGPEIISEEDWQAKGEVLANGKQIPSPREAWQTLIKELEVDRSLVPGPTTVDSTTKVRLRTDASSGIGAGGVLEIYTPETTRLEEEEINRLKEEEANPVKRTPQERMNAMKSTWRPVEMWSAKWTPSQRRYPVQEQELLAIVMALRHFEHLLRGVQFDLFTDNAACKYFLTKDHEKMSDREARWLMYLSKWSELQIYHTPGRSNIGADLLSRSENSAALKVVDLFAGSGSCLRALEELQSKFFRFDEIDYQAIEISEASRRCILNVHQRLLASGMPLTGSPFRLGERCEHDIRQLALMVGSEEDTVFSRACREELQSADIICAGPPCQPWSQASPHAKGFADSREGFSPLRDLMWLTTKAARLIENVPGFRDHQEAYESVTQWLGEPEEKYLLGPQKRKRLIWTNVPTLPATQPMIQQHSSLPMTWQDCLATGVDIPDGRSQSPTMCARIDTHSERDRSAWVQENNQLRPMNISERERLAGLQPGDSMPVPNNKSHQLNSERHRRTIVGNAIPSQAYLAWLVDAIAWLCSTSKLQYLPNEVTPISENFVNGREYSPGEAAGVLQLTGVLNQWHTRPEVFEAIEDEFGTFDIDLCANATNSLCPLHSTDCLKTLSSWEEGWKGFCNPPYSPSKEAKVLLKKMFDIAMKQKIGDDIVWLVPVWMIPPEISYTCLKRWKKGSALFQNCDAYVCTRWEVVAITSPRVTRKGNTLRDITNKQQMLNAILNVNSGNVRKDLVAIHKEGHYGAHRTATIYCQRKKIPFEPKLKEVVRDIIDRCDYCASYKPKTHLSERHVLPAPEGVWSDLEIDEITGLPPVQPGHLDRICCIVDRYSGFLRAFPSSSKWDSNTMASQVWDCVSFRGAPKRVHSDPGSTFMGAFKNLMKQKGIKILYGCAKRHTPQAHVENANRQVRWVLGALLHEQRMVDYCEEDEWPQHLQEACLVLNNSPRIHLMDFSPAEMMFGSTLRYKEPEDKGLLQKWKKWTGVCDDLISLHYQHRKQAAEDFNSQHRIRKPQEPQLGDEVWVHVDENDRRKIDPHFVRGHFVVKLPEDGDKKYHLRTPTSSELITRDLEHLRVYKPALEEDEDGGVSDDDSSEYARFTTDDWELSEDEKSVQFDDKPQLIDPVSLPQSEEKAPEHPYYEGQHEEVCHRCNHALCPKTDTALLYKCYYCPRVVHFHCVPIDDEQNHVNRVCGQEISHLFSMEKFRDEKGERSTRIAGYTCPECSKDPTRWIGQKAGVPKHYFLVVQDEEGQLHAWVCDDQGLCFWIELNSESLEDLIAYVGTGFQIGYIGNKPTKLNLKMTKYPYRINSFKHNKLPDKRNIEKLFKAKKRSPLIRSIRERLF